MEYIIFTFRSRNQTARMYEILLNHGISSQIINTPREANVGCGLSLKISENNLQKAKQIILRYPQASFAGVFKVYSNGRGFAVRRV